MTGDDGQSVHGTEQYSIPYEDYGERFGKYGGKELRGICRTLSSGDRVLVNKRERTLRVRTVEDCRDYDPIKLGDTGYAINPGPDGHSVHLVGNGTRYEIQVPPEPAGSQAPFMYWPSGERVVGYIDVVVDGVVTDPVVRSSVTAADLVGDVR